MDDGTAIVARLAGVLAFRAAFEAVTPQPKNPPRKNASTLGMLVCRYKFKITPPGGIWVFDGFHLVR